MLRITLVLLGVAYGVSAFAGDDEVSKADLKRMQGKWKIVRVLYEGQPDKKVGFTWTIKGNKLFVGAGWYSVLKLNAKSTPKAYDFEQYDAGGTLRSDKGLKAIYMFKGEDTLILCTAQMGNIPRPKAFVSKEGDGCRLFTLKRVKE
jgi:uncharacterized protein (TIGR03067 family)